MKVDIGPYKYWVGPYQIADLFGYIGLSQSTCRKIAEWLSETWVLDFCQWWHSRFGNRKINISIQPYDTWNCDNTIALCIVPLLERFNVNPGSHFVEYDDVKDFRSPEHEEELKGESDGHFLIQETGCYSERYWQHVISEMIFAFSCHIGDDNDNDININSRRENGLRLFAKYYGKLWT